MRGVSIITSLALVSFAAACGGENEKPPVPLPHHFDEMYIAKMLPNENVSQANAQFQTARQENLRAETEAGEVVTQLQVARNELKQTQLAIDSAITEKNAATKGGEANAMNAAQVKVYNAELVKKAADARVRFLDVYKHYANRYWLYTQEHMYWREAQLELVRSNIAKANGIQPVKIEFAWFPGQVDERGRRTQHAHDRAQRDKDKSTAEHDHWRKLQTESDKANNRVSQVWDPMAAPQQVQQPQQPMQPQPQPMPNELPPQQ